MTGVRKPLTGLRLLSSMTEEALAAVSLVNITDQRSIFKYIQIVVIAEGMASKTVIRGFADCTYHADIFDREEALLAKSGLKADCPGGGRIEHDPEKKYLKVYGYSQGFGKADHAQSKQILQTKYPDYTIEVSDDGY
ncbi:hypothetical protein KR009_007716 [Drosophila setifemur]|nr:hypothetical protein KR009_007716 [Drosophila setifemur]